MDKTADKKTQIIQSLKEHGSVTIAVKPVGITRQTFYNWQENDPTFKARSNAAIAQFYLSSV